MTHHDKFAQTAIDEAALLTHPAVLGLINSDTLQIIVGPYAAAPLATAFTRLLPPQQPAPHTPQ